MRGNLTDEKSRQLDDALSVIVSPDIALMEPGLSGPPGIERLHAERRAPLHGRSFNSLVARASWIRQEAATNRLRAVTAELADLRQRMKDMMAARNSAAPSFDPDALEADQARLAFLERLVAEITPVN
jgi:hypothetical protein